MKQIVKHKKILISFILLLMLVTTSALFWSSWSQSIASKKTVEASMPSVQSNVEMSEYNVNAQLGGSIKVLHVKEGDVVKTGQLLAELNNDTLMTQRDKGQAKIDTILAQIRSAEASRASAESMLKKMISGTRPEELAQAKASYDLAQQGFIRDQSLYKEAVISQVQMENTATQLEIAKQKYLLAKNGSRTEDISIAKAQLDAAIAAVQVVEGQLGQAKAELAETNTTLLKTKILAPADGTITRSNVKVGDLISTGMPLFGVVEASAPWVKCEIKENDLSKIRLNQTVLIKLPAYPNIQLNGKVISINKSADFAVKRATNDNGEFDVMSYGVKIELELKKEVQLYQGMTVFVAF